MMPRMFVISCATVNKKTHCIPATILVKIKIESLTSASPSFAAATIAVMSSQRLVKRYNFEYGWYFIRVVCAN